MCGLVGFIDSRLIMDDRSLQEISLKMGNAIQHRGPDASDTWSDYRHGIALGHRRLSIIDLSPTGNQPMTSSCGRYTVVYNGEIYNADDIRSELASVGRTEFRGHSDTEVLIEGFATWGIENTLKKLIGMFAIAAWDRKNARLSLTRDRLGIKPLYWTMESGRLIFGSEMKAIYAHPEWSGNIDRDALASFLRHNYIPGPRTAFRNIQKLQPGHILSVDYTLSQSPRITCYWSVEQAFRTGKDSLYTGGEDDLREDLDSLLSDAVKRRLVSDVPLGAFLSGGIDSSTVAALMQKNSMKRIKTFSIGFHEKEFNEAGHAAAVAKHLGTDHTELYVSPREAMGVIDDLPTIFDEPFSDSSQIPTYLVSKMTRQHVTVALSGDGGDELFGGYSRYSQAKAISAKLSTVPTFVRKLISNILSTSVSACPIEHPTTAKLDKLCRWLKHDNRQIYRDLVSHWDKPNKLVPGSSEFVAQAWRDDRKSDASSHLDWMRCTDLCTYLPDDILTKVDRASMAVGLEARVPILDHRVVEFALRLRPDQLITGRQAKMPLRNLLCKYVPRELIDRPKMGFGVPIDAWLRGPLQDWAEDLLSADMINKFGLLDATPVQIKLREHISGTRNWQYYLWDVLMLQSWCVRYKHLL